MKYESIKRLKNDIFINYQLGRYQYLTRDYHFRNTSKDLWNLWYGAESDSLSLRTMNYYYSKCMRGEIDADEFLAQLTKLNDAFAHEFELLDKANKEERR